MHMWFSKITATISFILCFIWWFGSTYYFLSIQACIPLFTLNFSKDVVSRMSRLGFISLGFKLIKGKVVFISSVSRAANSYCGLSWSSGVFFFFFFVKPPFSLIIICLVMYTRCLTITDYGISYWVWLCIPVNCISYWDWGQMNSQAILCISDLFDVPWGFFFTRCLTVVHPGDWYYGLFFKKINGEWAGGDVGCGGSPLWSVTMAISWYLYAVRSQ